MKTSSHLNLMMTAGFAMFAMFFGSGNLVFPLSIGTLTNDQCFYAILGLITTGVIVPFLGLLAMILFKGDQKIAFNYIGTWPAFFLTLAMLSLMGPFGVAARCIIVAHGGMVQIFPHLPLELFGILWSILSGFIILSHKGWLNVIGRYLTPVLLIMIAIIIIAGLWYAPSLKLSYLSAGHSFIIGLAQGYQTMDLLAAFFFSVTVVNYLHQSMKTDPIHRVLQLSLMSSIVGATLLAFVYMGLVLLGAAYSDYLITIPPEQRLVAVTHYTLGTYAQGIAATTMALACLTTFIVLVVLFAQFLQTTFRPYFSYTLSVWITLIITYAVSLLGFNALAAWIAYVLEIAYPALIAFAVSLIVYKLFKLNWITLSFWGVLIMTCILHIFQHQ